MKTKPILTLVCVLVALLVTGCTRPDKATRTLEAAGYTHVEITGWRPFAKSKDEFYSTGFRARGANGQTVTGSVTEGFLFKGSTIRLD